MERSRKTEWPWPYDKELPEEKLGRSHKQQTHTMSNTNTSFAKEKEETNGRTKNSKWTVPYGLSIRRLYKEKRKERNKKEKVENDKVEIFKNMLGVKDIY